MKKVAAFIGLFLITALSYAQQMVVNDFNEYSDTVHINNKLSVLLNPALQWDAIELHIGGVVSGGTITRDDLWDKEYLSDYYPLIMFYDQKLAFNSQREFPLNNQEVVELTILPSGKKLIFKYSFLNNESENEQKQPPVSKKEGAGEVVLVREFELGTNILNDARLLVSGASSDDKQEILKRYNILVDSLHLYPFLSALKPELGIIKHSSPREFKSNLLKTDVTNFASGMSQFLLERAKQELNESFFTSMYKQMDELPELQYFFPESYYFLKQINANNIQMNLEQLKNKFENDIRQFPVNLYNSKELTDSERFRFISQWKTFLDSTIPGKWIDLSLYTMIQSNWKINPKDLFYNFVHSEQRKELEQFLLQGDTAGADRRHELHQLNLLNTIKLTELISSGFLSNEVNRYWITEEQLMELISDRRLLETYIGLLIAKSDFENYTIRFYDSKGVEKDLGELLNPLYGKDYSTISGLLRDMYRLLNETDWVVQRLKTEEATENLIDNSYKLYSIFRETVQILSDYIEYRNVLTVSFEIDRTILYNYIVPCIDIAYHIQAKKYNLAINDAVLLLSNVTSENDKFGRFLTKFSRYGMLIATVAAAENSEQVKAAIESSVLPVGSSRVKRHAAFSFSLNAYVGGFYGQAFYKELVNGMTQKRSVGTFGITAPIGVSFNIGNIGYQKHKSAFSITTQVIDLGALVNFYHQSGQGASLPENTKIHLGDILAPGMQFSWSLGNSPVSAMAGFQYVANLNRLPTIPTNNGFIPSTWRIQAAIVVDIPLFNLKVWSK